MQQPHEEQPQEQQHSQCHWCELDVNAQLLRLERYPEELTNGALQKRVHALTARLLRNTAGDVETADVQQHLPPNHAIRLHGVLVKLFLPEDSTKQDVRDNRFDIRSTSGIHRPQRALLPASTGCAAVRHPHEAPGNPKRRTWRWS